MAVKNSFTQATAAPYVYQEYPRVLYRADGATCDVTSDAEKAQKLGEGWTLAPVADAVPSEPEAAQTADVIAPPADAPKTRRKKATVN